MILALLLIAYLLAGIVFGPLMYVLVYHRDPRAAFAGEPAMVACRIVILIVLWWLAWLAWGALTVSLGLLSGGPEEEA